MDIYDWNPEIDDFKLLYKQAIKMSLQNNDMLLKIKLDRMADREKFFGLMIDDMYETSCFHSYCNFLKYVSPNREIRSLARRFDREFSLHVDRLNQRTEIYHKVVSLSKHDHIMKQSEERVLIKRILSGFVRCGALLSSDEKKEMNELQQNEYEIIDQLHSTATQFEKLIGLSVDDVTDLPSELTACFPLVSAPKEPKKFGMPLRRTTYTVAMRHLQSEESRRKLQFIYNTWCLNSSTLFLQLILTQHQRAQLMGYESFGEMALQRNTLQEPNQVKTFLNEVLANSQRSFDREIRSLGEFKKGLKGSNDQLVNTWDLSHLLSRWKKRYGFDQDVVREYFMLGQTLQRIFESMNEMFSVRIIESADEIVWHPTVKKYYFYYNDERRGILYLDLFSRKGKFSGSGCFGLRSNAMYPLYEGQRGIPIMALVMNLNYSLDSLWTHSEIASFLHELGHVFHYFFRRSKYSIINASVVEPDFVQVPSQIFYNLAWNNDFIRRISSHYQTKATLPLEIAEKIVKTRSLEIGLTLRKRVFISVFDQLVHSSKPFIKIVFDLLKDNKSDVINNFMASTHRQLFDQVISSNKINPNPGIIFPTLWWNLIESRDGGMYSQLWSEITSVVIYNRTFTEHPSITKKELFRKLFEAEAHQSAQDIIIDLLGDSPSVEEYVSFHDMQQETEELSRFMNSDQMMLSQDQTSQYHISSDLSQMDEEQNHFSEFDAEATMNRDELQKMMQQDRLQDSDSHYYISEDTETLKRYDNIFIRKK